MLYCFFPSRLTIWRLGYIVAKRSRKLSSILTVFLYSSSARVLSFSFSAVCASLKCSRPNPGYLSIAFWILSRALFSHIFLLFEVEISAKLLQMSERAS